MPFDNGPMNRNIVWDAPGAVYGYCPKCGAPGEMRERLDGTGRDRCMRKHTYKSTEAKATGTEMPYESANGRGKAAEATARRRRIAKAARRS